MSRYLVIVYSHFHELLNEQFGENITTKLLILAVLI